MALRSQLSIRSILVTFVVIAGVLDRIVWLKNEREREGLAMSRLTAIGCEVVSYNFAPHDVFGEFQPGVAAWPAWRHAWVTGLRYFEDSTAPAPRGSLTGEPTTHLWQLVGQLDQLPHLSYLDLSHSHIDDDDLQRFPELAALEYLDLSDTEVAAASKSTFRAFPSVRCLSLRSCRLGSGLTSLFALANLERLDLSEGRRGVLAESAVGLSRPNKLTALYLSNSDVHDEDLRELRAFPGLEILDISDNPISTTGLSVLANFTCLRDVNLAGINTVALDSLPPLPRLRTVRLSGYHLSSSILKILRASPNLEQLYITESFPTESQITDFSQLKNARYVDIQVGSISQSDAARLVAMPYLESLSVSFGEIAPDAIATIGTSPTLKCVTLTGIVNANAVRNELSRYNITVIVRPALDL